VSRQDEIAEILRARTRDVAVREVADRLTVYAIPGAVPGLARLLAAEQGFEFATLVVDHLGDGERLTVRYFFYAPRESCLVEIATTAASRAQLPAISDTVHAADWHEREAEDLFGVQFAGHPFLGDFVLHDDEWPEDVAPMRVAFNPGTRPREPGRGDAWRPRRLLDEQGTLVFPVGPVWGDYAESGLWLLETPGEQIRQAHTRLFYKYRGVEKIAEGQAPEDALLLVERFSGNAAFNHAMGYCQALEKLAGCEVPPRAEALRVVFAELERIRYHASTIAQLAGSTALSVAKAMGQEIEEALLRLTGEVCGHRYLFGLAAPGGLAWNPADGALGRLAEGVRRAARELAGHERLLTHSSSFLDRIEEMGTLTPALAATYGVVGPVARAAARALDLRRALPYGGYVQTPPEVAHETEGDGYARLRVFFDEIRASGDLIRRRLETLPNGPVAAPYKLKPGGTLAWVEAPAGATFHWVRLDEGGRIARLRLGTPGFRNWHAFHRAVEGAAFQDFPIILASFGLTVAENDR
jgi:Ni,Fe-hydrogenase III large subunit/NADH:ubiquinone oxidoreductase subunit C